MSPRVHVLSLGGTIAMTRGASDGITPRLTGKDLVAAVPTIGGIADVSFEAAFSLPGAHLRLEDLAGLVGNIETLLRSGEADGVVITQGTDTIEETAYALDLLLSVDAPVVITGAMRPPDAPGADGPANLEAAVRVAAAESSRGRGAVVVLNEQIHSAQWVTKTHTSRPDAFRSTEAGPTGVVTEGRVRWFWPPCRGVVLTPLDGGTLPAVPLLVTWLGDSGTLLEAAVDLRPAGLVIEALGAGHVPPGLVAPLEQAARNIPVVLASRAGSGEVFQHTYGFPGSEIDLLGRGLLWSGGLPGRKARIFVSLALAAGWTRQAIASGLASHRSASA